MPPCALGKAALSTLGPVSPDADGLLGGARAAHPAWNLRTGLSRAGCLGRRCLLPLSKA